MASDNKAEKAKAAGLYILGFSIMGHEAFLAKEVSETLLLAAMALVGLPSTLIADKILSRPTSVDPPVAAPKDGMEPPVPPSPPAPGTPQPPT